MSVPTWEAVLFAGRVVSDRGRHWNDAGRHRALSFFPMFTILHVHFSSSKHASWNKHCAKELMPQPTQWA
jgi:hypothetical protein